MTPTDFPQGLVPDLALMERLAGRREVLGLAAGAGALLLLPGEALGATCAPTPRETMGPYPGNGRNRAPGPTSNVLTAQGVVRSDIRASFIGSQRRAPGVPLRLTVSLVDTRGCTPLAGRAIYLWQNDAEGLYSLYTAPQESYLRGLQATDAKGQAQFTTIVPGCYGGRSPHIHFEVYASLEAAAKGERALLSSQFLIPDAVCNAVYADRGLYAGSTENLRSYPANRDWIFGDNSAADLAAMTLDAKGSAPRGYDARVTAAIA